MNVHIQNKVIAIEKTDRSLQQIFKSMKDKIYSYNTLQQHPQPKH